MSRTEKIDSRDWGRRAFSPKRRKTLAALAEAMLSDEGAQGLSAPPCELTARVVDEFDLLIGAGSSDLRRGYSIIAWIIEWLPLFFVGAFARASRLPLARRVTYLERLEHARIALLATLFVAFKLPVTMLAFELDRELQSTGFDRDAISSARRPARSLQVRAG